MAAREEPERPGHGCARRDAQGRDSRARGPRVRPLVPGNWEQEGQCSHKERLRGVSQGGDRGGFGAPRGGWRSGAISSGFPPLPPRTFLLPASLLCLSRRPPGTAAHIHSPFLLDLCCGVERPSLTSFPSRRERAQPAAHSGAASRARAPARTRPYPGGGTLRPSSHQPRHCHGHCGLWALAE